MKHDRRGVGLRRHHLLPSAWRKRPPCPPHPWGGIVRVARAAPSTNRSRLIVDVGPASAPSSDSITLPLLGEAQRGAGATPAGEVTAITSSDGRNGISAGSAALRTHLRVVQVQSPPDRPLQSGGSDKLFRDKGRRALHPLPLMVAPPWSFILVVASPWSREQEHSTINLKSRLC